MKPDNKTKKRLKKKHPQRLTESPKTGENAAGDHPPCEFLLPRQCRTVTWSRRLNRGQRAWSVAPDSGHVSW